MDEADKPSTTGSISPKDISAWLNQEIADLAKAVELRIKEASALATAFAAGEISSQEAEDRLWRYQRRWGEALPGMNVSAGSTDEHILAAIDDTRRPDFTRKLLRHLDRDSPSEMLPDR